jgi:hypothetical protein
MSDREGPEERLRKVVGGEIVLVCPTCGHVQDWVPDIVWTAYADREALSDGGAREREIREALGAIRGTDLEVYIDENDYARQLVWHDVPWLLSRLSELEGEVRRLRGAIATVRSWYPEDVFLPDSNSLDAKCARMARLTCDNILSEASAEPGESARPETSDKAE